jgi:hypothetical protein
MTEEKQWPRYFAARDVTAERPHRILAARSGGDQERCREQDRHRQRRGHKYDRCLHRSPFAMPITAPRHAKVENGLGKYFGGQAGIGIAIATLIESTVRVTTRHNDNAPIASVAATASFRRDEATGAVRP